MSCKRLLVLIAVASLPGACGNYSNEDLEFMNVLPERDQLAAAIPARSSAITDAEEAELARTTHQVTATFNGMVDAFMAPVDAIRSFSPSSRTPDSRTWGPYPSQEHPGWLVRMIVRRDAVDRALFNYEIDFHLGGAADTDWPTLMAGHFQAGGTARRGTGSFDVTTAAVRAEGLDPDLGFLDQMHVDYTTLAFPVTVTMAVTNLPNPADPGAIMSFTYTYKAAADGQGQMTFDFSGNLVAGPMLDVASVTSDWLGSGQGRAVARIIQGEAAGAQQIECWDASFRTSFNDKPWAPAEDVGSAAACVPIPAI
jgi:hypothetical protein